jgi:hypothetical protein
MATGVVQQAAQLDPYAQEAAQISRNRAYAEALLAQSLKPAGPTEMVSGIALRRSPLEGLGKLAGAYFGRKGMEEADTATGQLGERYRTAQAQALREFNKLRFGSPETAVPGALTPNDDEGNPHPPIVTPGQAGNPQVATQFAAASPFAAVQTIGKDLAEQYGKLLAAGAREATVPSLAAAANSGNIGDLRGKQSVSFPEGVPVSVNPHTPTGVPAVQTIGNGWTPTTVTSADGKTLPAQQNSTTKKIDVLDKGVKVTTNVDTKGETALATNLAKNAAEDYQNIAKAGREAPVVYNTADRIEKLSKQIEPGLLAQPKMWADKFLAEFRASTGQKAATAEQITMGLKESALSLARQMKGALSDKDVMFLTSISGSIASEPETLMQVAHLAKVAAVNASILHQDAFSTMATSPGVTPGILAPTKPVFFPWQLSDKYASYPEDYKGEGVKTFQYTGHNQPKQVAPAPLSVAEQKELDDLRRRLKK